MLSVHRVGLVLSVLITINKKEKEKREGEASGLFLALLNHLPFGLPHAESTIPLMTAINRIYISRRQESPRGHDSPFVFSESRHTNC